MLWREDEHLYSPAVHAFALESLTSGFERSTRRTAMNRLPASARHAGRDVPRSEAEMRLHGYWLLLVRLLCLTLSVVSVGLFVASIPSEVVHLHLRRTYTRPSDAS